MPRQVTLVSLLAVAASTGVVRGDPNPQDAAAHLEAGRTLLAHRKLPEAVAELKAAYALDPRGDTLYRLAEALQLAGDHAGAIDAYRNYLATQPRERTGDIARRELATLERERDADAADAKEQAELARRVEQDGATLVAARKRVDDAGAHAQQLEAELAKATAAKQEAIAASASMIAAVQRADVDLASARKLALATPGGGGRAKRVVGLTLMVLGAGASAGAAMFGYDASQLTNTLDGVTGQWTTADDAAVAQGNSDQSNMNVLLSAGIVSMVAGLVLYTSGEVSVRTRRCRRLSTRRPWRDRDATVRDPRAVRELFFPQLQQRTAVQRGQHVSAGSVLHQQPLRGHRRELHRRPRSEGRRAVRRRATIRRCPSRWTRGVHAGAECRVPGRRQMLGQHHRAGMRS